MMGLYYLMGAGAAIAAAAYFKAVKRRRLRAVILRRLGL
jgi:hypothetical protein